MNSDGDISTAEEITPYLCALLHRTLKRSRLDEWTSRLNVLLRFDASPKKSNQIFIRNHADHRFFRASQFQLLQFAEGLDDFFTVVWLVEKFKLKNEKRPILPTVVS